MGSTKESKTNLFPELRKRDVLELLYLPLFIAIFVVLEYKILTQDVALKVEFAIVIALFGLLHILASNILSLLYNLGTAIIPFAPRATPRRLKILGTIFVVVSVLTAIFSR